MGGRRDGSRWRARHLGRLLERGEFCDDHRMFAAARRFADALATPDPIGTIADWHHAVLFDPGDHHTEHLERLSAESRQVYMVSMALGEISNGGFSQFFFNSSGNHCAEVAAALTLIVATEGHALLRKAMAWFPGATPSPHRATRQEQLEALEAKPGADEAFKELNERFWSASGAIQERLLAFVRARPDAFILRATASA